MALIDKLNDLGDAVRDLTGSTEKMTLEQMAEVVRNHECPKPVIESIEITENGTYEAPEGVDGYNPIIVATTGSIEVEPIVLTGAQSYGCAGAMAGAYIDLFGNKVSTNDITNCDRMFYHNTAKIIPFDINCRSNYEIELGYMFYYCPNLERLPKIYNAKVKYITNFCDGCNRLKEISDGYTDTWDWTKIHSGSYTNMSSGFNQCYALRHIAVDLLNNWQNPYSTNSYDSPYKDLFAGCFTLEEVNGLGISTSTYSSNMFSGTFTGCSRIKDFTFIANEDGTPKTAKWSNQTIDMTACGYVRYTWNRDTLLEYSDITADKEVKDDATYQALKDDPDYFTLDINYSRYNHTSAVNTINSLPDTSATGTNTIKFMGASGALTDGGAINTLTEEEIAVAASKGWTVSLV